MLGIVSLPLFLGAVFVLNVTPGPDSAFIVGRSVSQGRMAGVLSALGINCGCTIHVMATAFGLSALLAASPSIFLGIKILGAMYLIYLGVMILRQTLKARAASASNEPLPPSRPMSNRRLFTQGFITNLLNPKVILFFLSFFPQFVSAGSEHTTLAFLALGAIFIAMSLIWTVFLALVAGSLSKKVAGNDQLKRWVDRMVGMAFIGLGIKLAS
ncbi:LysE family translocator [Pokkaliibacter sp. CJK22405]|uniref:LysE family translocator n=1 Tax=Pokkaliibacter sp. CJK22405 TaxID=3384615 RepID=UPI0039847DD0